MNGRVSTGKFQVQQHFFGYEGRCAAPSNFDADYTYCLGHLAALLAAFGKTGYICAVQNLAAPPGEWRAAGVPLTSMMQMETRKGRPTPVIGKALVRTDQEPFRSYAAARERWAIEDDYLLPRGDPVLRAGGNLREAGALLLLEAGRRDEAGI